MQAADIIVVGSGPAGVSAAWPLVEAGVRVLMLDASDGVPLPAPPRHASPAAWGDDPDRWRHELGAAGPLIGAGRSPKFATPLAQATLAGFARTGLTTRNYFAVGSLAAGGLSRIWGALAAEFSTTELAAWGDQAAEMTTSYARVRTRIGTNPPPVLTPPVARLLKVYEARRDIRGFDLETASNAVLAEQRGQRAGCTACGQCLQGCGWGSIYHSAHELDALARHRNFEYRSGMLVTDVGGEAGRQIVSARCGGETLRFAAGAVVLAAGTLMTTKLALRRLGLAGRPVRLESNPVGGSAFLLPGMIGQEPPARSFGLGQLVYTLAPREGVEAAGVLYGVDSLPLSAIADRLPFTRPAALRLAQALMPAMVLATGYLPGRFSDNRLVLEDDGADGRLVIEGRQDRETGQLLHATFRSLGGKLRKLGAWHLPFSTQALEPGSDAHPGATLPLGAAGDLGTDLMGGLNGAPGIHVVDGASLPLLSARHPTLTIMANADRIARSLAQRFSTVPRAHADAG